MQSHEELKKNTEARDLYLHYQQKQQELQFSGYDAATLDELKAIQMKVKSNTTLTNYFTNQATLVALLKRTNDRITEKIGQSFARKRQGGCC